MVEYLIIAIAFAIMMHIRYIMEVLGTVSALRIMLNIEHEKNPFTPVLFSIIFFIVTSIFMPIMAIYTIAVKREEVIKEITGAIMKSYFQLEEK